MQTHPVRPLGRRRSSDADVRNLTVVGWFFGAISIAIVLGGAVSFYLWSPLARYYGIHVYGEIPALIVGIPLAGVAIGFFKAARCVCEAVGLPFVRPAVAPGPSIETVENSKGSPDDYPCCAATFDQRLDRMRLRERLLRTAACCWGLAALVACMVAYDKFVGPRTNGFTDVLYIAVASVTSFGPAWYLKTQWDNPKTFRRYGLVCPGCGTPLVGAIAAKTVATRCCPTCGRELISGREFPE